jgi:signal transduction histidine kinase
VVWMVNPENDHLESLVSFLCHLIHSLCEPASIRCRIDALGVINERAVPSTTRHHVSLAVKEAVHNALKHSGATELQASIRFNAPLLTILISDNGRGFEEGRTKQGNGISNMRHRMAMVKGRVAIESLKGKGTTICFEVPIS